MHKACQRSPNALKYTIRLISEDHITKRVKVIPFLRAGRQGDRTRHTVLSLEEEREGERSSEDKDEIACSPDSDTTHTTAVEVSFGSDHHQLQCRKCIIRK